MKTAATIPIAILFFAVSTFGNFIVGSCPPPECVQLVRMADCAGAGCGPTDLEPGPCGATETGASGCGLAPKAIPIQSCRSPKTPKPIPVKARCVLPIVLAFDPTTIPCCAKVCTIGGLSDFREESKSDSPSPDLLENGSLDIIAACLEYEIPSIDSRPTGIHPTISTTVLRL